MFIRGGEAQSDEHMADHDPNQSDSNRDDARDYESVREIIRWTKVQRNKTMKVYRRGVVSFAEDKPEIDHGDAASQSYGIGTRLRSHMSLTQMP